MSAKKKYTKSKKMATSNVNIEKNDDINKDVNKENSNIEIDQENLNNSDNNEEIINEKDEEVQLENEELEEKKIETEKVEIETDESKKDFDKDKEENKEDKENSKNNELVCVSNKEDLPEYVKKMVQKRKMRLRTFLIILVIMLFVFIFSTVFALINMKNTNIITGVSIRNIDVSNNAIEEAENKLNEILNKQLEKEITIQYGNDYKITLKPEQIEFKYDIKDAVLSALNIGRNRSIIENNYEIIDAYLRGKNLNVNYSYNKELLDKFVEDVNSKLPGLVEEPSYYIDKNKLFIDRGKDGLKVDEEKLSSQIIEAILARNNEDSIKEDYKQIIEMPIIEAKSSEIDVKKIHDEIYTEPKDAYFEKEPYKLYPDVPGVDFAISLEEAQKIIDAEEKQEYVIPLKISKAKITINELGIEAFPYLVSEFSTRYDASNRNRSTNLEIAAKKINGKVLMPGEVFSFNKIVGKRTVEEGYKDAKIYADGAVVDGLAGGICQISSTLYNAALLANLEIVERRNHSFPTSYIRTGRDATVVYGKIDLQFKNSRSTPIKIEAKVKNGIAEFKIHGMQEPEEYEIKILPSVTATLPFSTQTIPDPTLMPGQQIVETRGKPGYKVTTYIEKRLNGQLVSRNILSNDTYVPMKNVVRVGPGIPPVQ